MRGSSSTTSSENRSLDIVCRLVRVDRELHLEAAAPPQLAFDRDGSAVASHDAVTGGEPEPGADADLLGGEERIEDAPQVLGRDAGAVVADRDQHRVAAHLRAQPDPARL